MSNSYYNKKAFTLIELLLAMTLTTIIILGVQGAYRQGKTVWEKSENDVQVYNQINTLTEMLRTELSSIYNPNQQSSSNKNDDKSEKTEIFTLTGSGLSFYTANPSNNTSPRYSRISKVSYSGKQNKLSRKEVLAAGNKIIEAASDIENDLTNSVFDIPNVKFEACVLDTETRKFVWKNNFKSEDSLPKAVSVTFQINNQISKDSEVKLIVICEN